MTIYLTLLLLLLMIFGASGAEEIKIAMSLQSARRILEAAGAKEDHNAYHFPWTSRFVEVKVQDGETYEESEKRIASELEKMPSKRGYSVFFSLQDKTRLQLVLEVEGDSKRIRWIRLGKDHKVYRDKFDWIADEDQGRIREFKTLDPKR
jgi:hypothetical protein